MMNSCFASLGLIPDWKALKQYKDSYDLSMQAANFLRILWHAKHHQDYLKASHDYAKQVKQVIGQTSPGKLWHDKLMISAKTNPSYQVVTLTPVPLSIKTKQLSDKHVMPWKLSDFPQGIEGGKSEKSQEDDFRHRFIGAKSWLSVLKSIENDYQLDADQTPRSFPGKIGYCDYRVGTSKSTSCCSPHLQRHHRDKPCPYASYQLALDRQNHATHKIGEYCQQSRGNTCLVKREVYCRFHSSLARLIQEKGREWLKAFHQRKLLYQDRLMWDKYDWQQPLLAPHAGIWLRPCHQLISQPDQYCLSIQKTGKDFQDYIIPSLIADASPFVLNDHPKMTLVGSCDAVTGQCHYRLNTYIQIQSLKPLSWGTPKKPNCQGLTEKALLFFRLSAALDRYEDDQQASDPVALMSQHKQFQRKAVGQMNEIYHAPDRYKLLASHPNEQGWKPMQITPLQGQGPFVVTARIAGEWLDETTDHGKLILTKTPIKKIHIYWGDGTMRTVFFGQQKFKDGKAFYRIQHHYDPPEGHNQLETILALFYIQDRVEVVQFRVLNRWLTRGSDQDMLNIGGGAVIDREHWVDFDTMPGLGHYTRPK